MARKRRTAQRPSQPPLAGPDVRVDDCGQTTLTLAHAIRSLVQLFVGGLLGFGLASAYGWILVAQSSSRYQLSVDSTLVTTQQLDQLFNVIETKLDNGNALDPYIDLFAVFRMYDSQFVSLYDGNVEQQLSVAYATKRMGHCALVSGDVDTAFEHYHRASIQFEKLMRASPEVIGLYSQWISVNIQVIFVELERGNLGPAQEVFLAAFDEINRSRIAIDAESSVWLAPQYESLALFGIQLKREREAAKMAYQFNECAQLLAKKYPKDLKAAQQAMDARELLDRLTTMNSRST